MKLKALILDESKFDRIIAIGDLHGIAEPLYRLIDKLNPTDSDALIFIGDYIDRGPQSKEVIEKLLELKMKHNSVYFLMGNHEDMLLGSVGFPAVVSNFDTWMYNGGSATLRSYGMGADEILNLARMWNDAERGNRIIDLIPESHMEFFKSLYLYIETGSYFFCHAGISPHKTVEEGKQSTFDLLWIREHIGANNLKWEKKVICGHTPLEDVLVSDKLICIDTGLYYYGLLSAIDVVSGEIFQVRGNF